MPDLLTYFLSGDLIGWIEAVYVSLIGETFYGFLIMALGVVVWMRTQSALFVAILWIVSGSVLWSVLPFEGRQIAWVFLILGTAVGIWTAWFGSGGTRYKT